VPTRVTIKLKGGATHEMKIAHPRGSPRRRMSWDELSALFRDTVADAMPAATLTMVLDLVAALDRDARPREIMTTYVATPGWLERGD
jgi:2-methylcitrate dehydratase PrpD